MLSHVKAEDLLDLADFRLWGKVREKVLGSELKEEEPSDGSAVQIAETRFEAISAHAWTHVFSQLIKVCIDEWKKIVLTF